MFSLWIPASSAGGIGRAVKHGWGHALGAGMVIMTVETGGGPG